MKTLALVGLLAFGVLFSPSPTASADETMGGIGNLTGDARVVHVLNRLGYGARPGDVARVKEMGLYQYIALQLHPEKIDDAACEKRLAGLDRFRMTAGELAEKYPGPNMVERKKLGEMTRKVAELSKDGGTLRNKEEIAGLRKEIRKIQGKNNRYVALGQLSQAKMIRAVHSERQLQQVMADFWFNHFNIFARKGGAIANLLPEFEETVIRANALGSFEDLLTAVAKSPAMLFYLDNWMSVAPPGAKTMGSNLRGRISRRRNKARGLNENYGRELLELHTLGVDNGYTQEDIIEVARCFTGWTIQRANKRGRGGFLFRREYHDAGEKTVMGMKVEEGRGVEDGMQVLKFLASHPNTARFISLKLCRRFVSDNPPPALVERCAGTFLETDGDIRMVLYRIFTSPEFHSKDAVAAKMKKPHEYVASSFRALGVSTNGDRRLGRLIGQMGEPLYFCEPPTGFSDAAEKWGGTNSILSRVNFATALATGKIRGSKPNWSKLLVDAPTDDAQALMDWMAMKVLGKPMTAGCRAALGEAIVVAQATFKKSGRKVKKQDAAAWLATMILGSPDFQMQ